MSSNPLIKIDNLNKVFYTDEIETHALSDIDLHIGTGEYVSIAGPSGCGKSTLLSILGLLDTPSGGSYQLNGVPVEDIDVNERARIRNQEIGFVFQAFNLIGELTVAENVAMPLVYREGISKVERLRLAEAALERVAMAHRLNHYPGAGRGSEGPACGRANRQPRFPERRGRHGVTRRIARPWRDHLHGDSRSALRRICPTQHSPVRRPHRRRGNDQAATRGRGSPVATAH